MPYPKLRNISSWSEYRHRPNTISPIMPELDIADDAYSPPPTVVFHYFQITHCINLDHFTYFSMAEIIDDIISLIVLAHQVSTPASYFRIVIFIINKTGDKLILKTWALTIRHSSMILQAK